MFDVKKFFHKHDFKITERSNVIQYDEMGYPLRLYISKCDCGISNQEWIDIDINSITKDDVVCKWTNVTKLPCTQHIEETNDVEESNQ